MILSSKINYIRLFFDLRKHSYIKCWQPIIINNLTESISILRLYLAQYLSLQIIFCNINIDKTNKKLRWLYSLLRMRLMLRKYKILRLHIKKQSGMIVERKKYLLLKKITLKKAN